MVENGYVEWLVELILSSMVFQEIIEDVKIIIVVYRAFGSGSFVSIFYHKGFSNSRKLIEGRKNII